MSARLGLGTAQFGLDYGIANAAGRVAESTARRILDRAAELGVDRLDTAPAYGEAEAVLGRLGAAGRFSIVTKTDPAARAAALPTAVRASLRRLGTERCAVLLVHDRRALLDARGMELWTALERLRDAGLVGRIGASFYHPEEGSELLARYPLQVVQLPLNVFDQRALTSGLLDTLQSAGVEVHARSPLLQGLLTMDPLALPAAVRGARPRLQAFRHLAAELGVSPAAAALGFALAVPGVDAVICGVDGVEQLEAACRAVPLAGPAFADLATADRQVVDPSRWEVDR